MVSFPKARTLFAMGSIALSLTFASAAYAAPVFFDDFNGETYGLNKAPTGFSVAGSVDIIGNGPNGSGFDLAPGNGYYIDLDGTGFSGTPASILTLTSKTFGPGMYKVEFDLAGNLRNSDSGTTEVFLGDGSTSISLSGDTGFKHFSFLATVESGEASLRFQEDGAADNIGNLLDNVSVSTISSVPLPAGLPLFGAGLLGLAAFGVMRRGKVQA